MKSAKWIKENKDEKFIKEHNTKVRAYQFIHGNYLVVPMVLENYFSKYERKVVK